jgi:RHS repeat-associated protein
VVGNITAAGNIVYNALDALGSTAETVNGGNGQVTQMRYYPYGEVQNGTSSEYMWTNEIRDPNGNDRFAFRTYAAPLGRWLKPDPLNLGAVDPTDPQSWNRYSYVRNQPLNARDPLGLDACVDPGHGQKPLCHPDGSQYDHEPATGTEGGELWDNMDTDPFDAAFFGNINEYDQYASSMGWQWMITFAGITTTYNSFDAFADAYTSIEAMPQVQAWNAFVWLAKNLGLDPNALVTLDVTMTGFAVDILLTTERLNTSAAAAAGWQDPLNSFHNGQDSWYLGDLFLDAVHLIDNQQGAEAHIDPFGPLNPLHFFFQVIPGWIAGGSNLGQMTCSVNGGCQ